MRSILKHAFLTVALVASALPAFSATTFRHPGVLVTRGQLDFVRERIDAGDEPWKSAFAAMQQSRYASLDHQPKPRAVVECGPYSKPNYGCRDERDDASAAYTHALLWQFTRQEAHAKKAIEIMNAWAGSVQSHIGHNAPLQASWAASIWPRAAEIIRYTYEGWAKDDIERFGTMLRKAYLPPIEEGRPIYNGNWELSMIEAMISVGVFLEDQRLFDKAIAMWRKRVPAYFYLTTDGELPVPPPLGNKTTRELMVKYWYGQEKFVDGLGQETCRDFGHLQMGLAAMIDTAETALIHGIDLYGEEGKRITAAMEFHAGFLLGDPIPEWLGGGELDLRAIGTWEIAYNHYHGRIDAKLPRTEELIRTKVRPTRPAIFMLWETLTHAELGVRGLQLSRRGAGAE